MGLILLVIVIVFFGIFIPFITIAVFPIRALFAMGKSPNIVQVLWLTLILCWLYGLVLITSKGYTTTTFSSDGGQVTGPTVSPTLWLGISIAWLFLEVVSFLAKQSSGKSTDPKPTDDSRDDTGRG